MNVTVDNTVDVATVIDAAGLEATIDQAAGESAVVSYTLPVVAVVQPSQSINLVTVSGPQGPVGPPGSGSITNLTGQYPIFYDAGSGIVGIVSGYYVTFPDLTSASGALVAQISAASAGVNALNGISGFVSIAAANPLFVSVAGQTITISGSGLATSGDLTRYYLNTNPSGFITTGQTGQFYAASNPQQYVSSGFVTGVSGALQAMMGSNTGVISINGATGALDLTGAGNVTVSRAGQLFTISGTNSGEVSQVQLLGASGALQTQINALPTAAQLAQTGSDLYRLITGESGQGVIDYATKVQLTQSGVQLIARDNSISGILQGQIDGIAAGTGSLTANVVYTSGTQFISGTKYFIGNTYVDNLFVTGMQTVINTQDFYVADNWIVMNATGAARDSALFISTGFTGVAATGAVIGWDVPSNSWRFGLASQQTDLFTLPLIASGEAVDAAIVRANSMGQVISGDLTITGQTLGNKINSLSGQAEGIYVHRTGNEFITSLKTFQQIAFDVTWPISVGSMNDLLPLSPDGTFVLYGYGNSGHMSGTNMVIGEYNRYEIYGPSGAGIWANTGNFIVGNSNYVVASTGRNIVNNVVIGNNNLMLVSGSAAFFSNLVQGSFNMVDFTSGVGTSQNNTFDGHNNMVQIKRGSLADSHILGASNVLRADRVIGLNTHYLLGASNSVIANDASASNNVIIVGRNNQINYTSGVSIDGVFLGGVTNVVSAINGNTIVSNTLVGQNNNATYSYQSNQSYNSILGTNNAQSTGAYNTLVGQGLVVNRATGTATFGLGTSYLQINSGISGAIFNNLNVGIGTLNPTGALHVNGPVCLSGINTSTTASVGAATLPANPVGFIVINITGGNFKIPYYNI